MSFLILNNGNEKLVESIEEGLNYLANKAMLAQHNDETGLNFSMLRLTVGESLILDDAQGNEIQVKRLA